MFGGFTDVAYMRDHTVTSLGYQNSTYVGNGGTSDTLTPDEQFLYTPMGSTSLISEYFWNIMGKEQLKNTSVSLCSQPDLGNHPRINIERSCSCRLDC